MSSFTLLYVQFVKFYVADDIKVQYQFTLKFGHLPGQFYHGIEYEVANLHPGAAPDKPDATMFVKGQELNVTRCVNLSVCSISEFLSVCPCRVF